MTVDLKIDLREYSNGRTSLRDILDTLDFSDWHLYDQQDEEFRQATERLICKVMSEAFRNVLQSQPPTIAFESDGKNMTVSINLGSSWNDGWLYFISNIEEMIDDFIETSDPGQMAGGDEARTELEQCLLRCASKLNAAGMKENDDG